MKKTNAKTKAKAKIGGRARLATRAKPAARPKTIDAYLATVSPDKRSALQRLRRDIAAAAPGAEECIAYGIPTFRLDGRVLVSFGAGANHCAFYPGAIVGEFAGLLGKYDTSVGTIRFAADRPLPATLVRKLVKAQIARRVPGKARPARRRPEVKA